jgi:hypothetical protein
MMSRVENAIVAEPPDGEGLASKNRAATEHKTALVLTIIFLGMIFIPPIYQYYYDARVLERWEFDDLLMAPPTGAKLGEFEKSLNNSSRLAIWVRRHIGKPLAAYFGDGNMGPVYPGMDGYLFYSEEIAAYRGRRLLDPPPASTANMIQSILDYNAQLRVRGIHLVLLPVPMKISIYPEKLWPNYDVRDGPAYTPDYKQWLSSLRENGIDVLDLTPALWKERYSPAGPVFFKQDTHWSWSGQAIAADAIAQRVSPMLGGCERIQFDLVKSQRKAFGDLARINNGSGEEPGPIAMDSLADAVYRNGRPYVAGNEAPVLLIGDSNAIMGSATGHGLEDCLMMRLHVGVQSISELGGGAVAARWDLKHRPGALANKKVVIWEFAGRFLWSDDWTNVSLPDAKE